ncbi:pyruvate dehydrogenase (acetyl-transferring) E1 component subunit alpha [Natronomonas salsuginis]|uniref:Pyruvate dehydrogenase (Acetyl-transferring) E1 component subunit alpha n=1 Tax=Natronomonas salsuginis TaxID=2217661 RepID=A0A4U5J622_9EURY|nr:pyruvate dehydrogenase (acetyl-transferring) E1 component subunit alpha [Natronomonas salsuginis]TKR24420.1 pyruvate dehydrogenase (acetyl-transferring) E1 component subunit alpha [Natronomonas salsuginis]
MAAVHYQSSDYVQILDPDGTVRSDASVPDLPEDELVAMYKEMRFARHFDERTISLQRQGRMGTYTPMAGQEGAQIGSAHALGSDDWFIPSYREHGAKMALGVDPKDILLYWMGNEVGNQIPTDLNIFTDSISVGTHPPHAAGMAWASKLRNEDRAFLCHLGDGATSQGDFHEGLNFAGVFDLPTVFFCNNNQWAISVPRERQTASETFAQKAHAYGFEGVQVDGMDPLAVYQVTSEALSKARSPDPASDDGPGGATRPTLIEAVQYRFGAHTTADDPSVYRDDEEVDAWKRKDPITRLGRYLRNQGLLDDTLEATIDAEIKDGVAEAIETAESYVPTSTDMFDSVFAERTDILDEQAAHLEQLRERYGDEELLE